MAMNERERRELLTLAREAIRLRLLDGRDLRPTREQFPDDKFWQNQGVFVTLTERGELRGCIGTILPVSPLVEAVAANARAAAFEDPRFEPVDETEFADLRIEISLLSVPEQLSFTGRPDLEAKLAESHPGVILQLGMRQATFLPQVWDELPDASDFLEALCHKAGLPTDSLRRPELAIFTYTVEAFAEPEE
ncbi:MAG: AmmeMemoRadiSam system protein A [Candidatus Cryosericum sp.]|nr:AmmeMemoRadiSam system protein A [Candidatus Cryosericum sp.]HPS69504.1 AmmeMemoRadiSam system protein A [Candidatus Cryosericum sp.]